MALCAVPSLAAQWLFGTTCGELRERKNPDLDLPM
jgi:hypothetical protein